MNAGWLAWWLVVVASIALVAIGLALTLRGWKND